jgi:uncharacterized protein (TIGR03066 family)
MRGGIVKNRRTGQMTGADKASRETRRRWPPIQTWLFVGALFLVSAGVAYFTVAWFLRPTLPDEIVGDWRIEGGEMNGTRVSFARDGTFTTFVLNDGKEVEVKATVRKQGDTLCYTMTLPNTGQKVTRTQTIKSLTERQMIVEENRQQSRLVRVDMPKRSLHPYQESLR